MRLGIRFPLLLILGFKLISDCWYTKHRRAYGATRPEAPVSQEQGS
jgi:hypothetical protein